MPKKPNIVDSPAGLRRRAERQAGKHRALTATPHTEADAQRLLHELEVHQIELEMQNAALRSAYDDLQETVTALEAEILNRQGLELEILEISEREQTRLGQDLHDGIGQELTGIAMICNVLANRLLAQSDPVSTSVGQISDYIRAAIESTRRLSKSLYPIELDRSSLLPALKDLADQTSHRTGIRCELRQRGEEPHLDRSVEIQLYRIVQECIANAIRHGRPSHITIESRAGKGTHTFTITNDGVGFVKPAITTHMGLHLMNYRARAVGAAITIEQPAQGGCRVICSLKV